MFVFAEMPAATNTAHVNAIQHTSRPSKPFGHGYPALQPGYQNSASPHGSQSNTPVHQPVYQQYPSVSLLFLHVKFYIPFYDPFYVLGIKTLNYYCFLCAQGEIGKKKNNL